MNTVFARTVLALCLVALPTTAFASAPEGHAHHHSVAKKEGKKDSSKRHGHKASAPKHASKKH